jgi:hypothetical protein
VLVLVQALFEPVAVAIVNAEGHDDSASGAHELISEVHESRFREIRQELRPACGADEWIGGHLPHSALKPGIHQRGTGFPKILFFMQLNVIS